MDVWQDGAQLPLLDRQLVLRIDQEGLVRVHQTDQELWVPTPLTPSGLDATLERWYRRQARSYLERRLREWAKGMQVTVTRVTIRGQTTRWGSCSSTGAIHLNWRLMQLPARLVDYVLVHELCHRLEMNHSAAFWLRVAQVLPDYRRLRHELKQYRIV